LEDAKKDITELTNHIDKSCKLLEQKDDELNEKSEQSKNLIIIIIPIYTFYYFIFYSIII